MRHSLHLNRSKEPSEKLQDGMVGWFFNLTLFFSVLYGAGRVLTPDRPVRLFFSSFLRKKHGASQANHFHWNTLTKKALRITGLRCYIRTLQTTDQFFLVSEAGVTNMKLFKIRALHHRFQRKSDSQQLLILYHLSSSKPIWYIHKKHIEFTCWRWWCFKLVS